MSAKLPFRVVKCSSHDDGYDHTQLETSHPSPHTKGWQSARFCDFPQTIVLDFRKVVSIRKIQILSHQSKIASKIELQVGTSRTKQNDPNTAEWTRLGYMSLDSNQRSNFKARELKSVYVHTRGRFLKLVVKKCHINTINLFNQVGIVCVNVVGPTSKDQEAPADDLATGMSVDETTQVQIAELHRRKAQAIKREHYDEAKRLKYAIESLKRVGAKVADLERLKRIAVSNEDYDRANELKASITRMRRDGLAGLAAQGLVKVQGGNGHDDKGGRKHGMASERPLNNNGNGNDNDQRDHHRQQRRSHNNNNHHHQVEDDYDDRPLDNNSNNNNHNSNNNNHNNNNNRDHQDSEDRGYDPQDRPLNNKNNGNNNNLQDERPLNNNNNNAQQQQDNAYNEDRPLNNGGNSNGNYHDPADRPLNNKGKQQQLSEYDESPSSHAQAESLSASQRTEAEALISMFGLPYVENLYSRTWSLRAKCCTNLAADIKANKYKQSATLVFENIAQVVIKAGQDKVAQVLQAACDLLQATVKQLVPSRVNTHESSPLLDPVIDVLLEKLGGSNARMQKSASQALQFLGMYQGVDTAVVSKALLKPILKRDAGKPLPVKGRGELLLQFLPELGLSDQTGLSAPAVMAWVLQYMDHRDGGIRELMVKISTEIYLLVGEQRMQAFLKKCRPAIQDNLTASFERADSRQPADRKTKQKPPANTSNNNNNAQQQNPNDSLSSTFGKEKFNVIHKHAHEHTGQFSHDQGEMSYEDGDQGYCQFCGEEDPSFTDEKLDLHYWQDCPMLTSCKQCEQVIEIPTLDEHLLEECEVANKYVKCKACKAPVVKESLEDHQASAACAPLGKGNNRCPLCSRAIGKGEEGWKVHLLDDGCPQNPRGRR